jgi:hypothetical protein
MASSLATRIYYATPVLGPLTRAIEKDIDLIWYVLVILLTALVLAVKTWGLVALTMTALALVPMMFTVLILISRP